MLQIFSADLGLKIQCPLKLFQIQVQLNQIRESNRFKIQKYFPATLNDTYLVIRYISKRCREQKKNQQNNTENHYDYLEKKLRELKLKCKRSVS